MVGATRGTPKGFWPDQASGSQQPPPAPPNLSEVMARQMELLNQLVQAQMGQFHHQSRGRDEHPSACYQDFLSTQPPLFHKADEPLDVTHGSALWSPSLHCYLHHAQTRTRHSSQLNNFTAPPAYGGTITTPCSQLVMLSHGINFGPLSEGLIEQKLNEFLTLTQGTRTVMQYAQAFNHLC
jgi:hypothetical protein